MKALPPPRELRWIKQSDLPARADVHDILVEDIVDSARTLTAVEKEMKSRNPTSLTTIVLLDRPEARAEDIDYEPTIVGFTITDPEAWAIGFGLDLDEQYRDLSHIYGKLVRNRPPQPYTLG